MNLGVQSRSSISKKRKLKDNTKEENGESLETSIAGGVVLHEVLEEAPKWKVLSDVLEEIRDEREKEAFLAGEIVVESEQDDSGIVLVACKDERSCMQLEDFITHGAQKTMREEWKKYLLSKVELKGIETRKKKPTGAKGFGILDGVIPSTPSKKTEAGSISKQENDALLAAASKLSRLAKEDVILEDNTLEKKGKGTKKRRTKKNEDDNGNKFEISRPNDEDQTNGVHPVLRRHNDRLPPVQFYAIESDQPILDILKPTVIIVYHADVSFVREIEGYKSENPSRKVKVYFLFYDDSTEVRKYEASIRRENGAFESLIRQKSLMMIPVDQDGRCLGVNSSVEPESITSQNSITRKAGGRKEVEKEKQVIVDMREFMSSLPNVLHQKGMRIIPVTLEVGDYILSPLICVERKSIQDLFLSFTSGHLYHQVETMVRYYRIPVLLIEFSQEKSFSFQSASDIGDDVTPNSIISKLSLLVLHFPRLRIVWSRSLHATAEIFASLKANQDEPDEAKAIRVGVPSEEGVVEDDVRAENYNTSAVEFLRRLPGVTDSNYRAIMDGCKSLAELALLSIERLAEIMGGQKAAHTLRDFLDAKYPTLI